MIIIRYNILNNNWRLRSTPTTCFEALSGLVLVLFLFFFKFLTMSHQIYIMNRGFVLHNRCWSLVVLGRKMIIIIYIFFFSTAGQTGVLVCPRTIVIVHYLRTVDFFSLFVTPQIENGSNLIELEI